MEQISVALLDAARHRHDNPVGDAAAPGPHLQQGIESDLRDDSSAIERTTEIFKALSHPLRVEIVRELASGDRAVHELVSALDVPQARISEHLATLRGARLVKASRVGRNVVYRLVDQHAAHIVNDAIAHAVEVWPKKPPRPVQK